MIQDITVFGFIITTIFIIHLIIKIHYLHIGENNIRNGIIEHYADKGLIVNNISNLNLMERIKYRALIFSVFRIYRYFFGIISGKIDYIRKVDVLDKTDKGYTKYIELIVQWKDIISFKEFASYEI